VGGRDSPSPLWGTVASAAWKRKALVCVAVAAWRCVNVLSSLKRGGKGQSFPVIAGALVCMCTCVCRVLVFAFACMCVCMQEVALPLCRVLGCLLRVCAGVSWRQDC
jgi:hypothetical protein